MRPEPITSVAPAFLDGTQAIDGFWQLDGGLSDVGVMCEALVSASSMAARLSPRALITSSGVPHPMMRSGQVALPTMKGAN